MRCLTQLMILQQYNTHEEQHTNIEKRQEDGTRYTTPPDPSLCQEQLRKLHRQHQKEVTERAHIM